MSRGSPKFRPPSGSVKVYTLTVGPLMFEVLACIARGDNPMLLGMSVMPERTLRILQDRQYVDENNQLTVYGQALWTLLSPFP